MMIRTHSRKFRRVASAVGIVLALGLIAVFMRSCWITCLVLNIPTHRSFSGPIEDGLNASGIHGRYGRTIDFSPDGTFIAYIWSEAEFVYPPELGARPRTLKEIMNLRVRRLAGDASELDIPLDSVDLRPDGITYFGLGVGLQASPDSRHVVAIVARRLVLVDTQSGEHESIEYDGEFFGSVAWVSANRIVFSTQNADTLTFWRHEISSPPAERAQIYSEPSRVAIRDALPPDLRHDQWSPHGRFVSFTSFKNTNQGEAVLLDTATGKLYTFPFSLRYQCWKHDESAVLVTDILSDSKRITLVEPTTGQTEDLTDTFKKAFGDRLNITMVSPTWTVDDRFVVLYETIEYPPKNDFTGWKHEQKGHVVQPRPLRVVLTEDKILRWSPVPDWFLLQGQMTFKWIDILGKNTAPIKGWVNDWTWAKDGRHAARLHRGELEVLSPNMPPTAE